MNKIAEASKKYRETILYLIVGTIVAGVNWGSFYLFTSALHINVNLSNALSIFCAFILAFVLNKVIVFQKKEWTFKAVTNEFITFFFSRLFTAIIEWGTVPIMQMLHLDYELFGIEAGVAKLTGCIIGTVLNYFLSKFWVFRVKNTDDNCGKNGA